MILSQLLSRNEILESIWQTVPIGAPPPTEVATLDKLQELTRALINKSHPHSLAIDPFTEVYKRRIIIDRPKIESLLTNKVVLITGGRGFVGTNLIAKLQQFGVKRIVAVDISTDNSQQIAIDTSRSNPDIPVTYYCGDVRDPVANPETKSLQQIFEIERPQIVFHLAAERLPGLAEIKIHHTVSTNILGCEHIIQLCEDYGVESCIFSSTGKSSRYFTPDIYAASKKIGEWLFSDNSQVRNCQYGIVRFAQSAPISIVVLPMALSVCTHQIVIFIPKIFTNQLTCCSML
jgi:FlaA1/EpsC-like NDP-sugar epimerase